MSLRKLTLLILFLVAVLWLPVGSMMAQIFSGTNKTRVMGRANRGPNYFAIMGHIKHPMAYQLPTSAPSLVDFIRFAGGALKSTTGEVLIFRQNRVVTQTTLTANSTIKLMPGDLVILPGGRAGRGKIYRGGSNQAGEAGGDSERLHQIALFGVLPHPVIMQMTPDVATKRWILQQLRQDLSIASSVKVVSRRHFGAPPGIDTRLTDNTVLVFADGLINAAALPRLPGPFRAGTDRHPDQRPLTRNQPDAPSAAAQLPLPIPDKPSGTPTRPGYSDMPDARESAETTTVDPEATREILTHPGSVPLDERQPTLPGRAHIGDTGSASVARPSPARTAPAARDDSSIGFNPAAIPSSEPREQLEGGSEAETPSSEFVAPEAVKPFVSQPDRKLTPVLPESAEPESAPRPETSALPLTPITPGEATRSETAPRDSTATAVPQPAGPGRVELLNPPASLEPTTPEKPQERPGFSASPSAPVAIPVPMKPEAEERASTPAPSLASQSADELANSIREKTDAESAGADSSDEAASARAGVEAASKNAGVFSRGDGGGSRIVPHKDDGTSWPLIAAGFIGSLGFLAAFSLLLSMTGPAPPTPAKAAKSDREWLDEIINDELPIEEEPAAEPAVSELFGRPTDAPVLRLDAEHREVPRPHFLDRGHQTGVGQPRAPQPDMPEPEDKQPEDKPNPPPIVVPPRRTDSPSRTPDVPLAPAASEPATVTAISDPPGIVEQLTRSRPTRKKREQKPHLGRKIFRIDSTHGAGVPSKKTVGQPASQVVSDEKSQAPVSPQVEAETESAAKISVQPAQSVAAGSDLLDRILASVEPHRKQGEAHRKQTGGAKPTGHTGRKEQP